MAVTTTLTWRKVPRDLMRKTETLYILKRLPEDRKLQLGAVLHGLYEEADDQGYVDLEDIECFCDYCWINKKEDVEDILDRLKERKLITETDIRYFFIEGWEAPYAAGDTRKQSLSLADRRKRIETAEGPAAGSPGPASAATTSPAGVPKATSAPKATRAKPAPAKKSEAAALAAVAGSGRAAPDAPDTAGADSGHENDTKGKNVATSTGSDKIGESVATGARSDKIEKNVATHRERERPDETEQKERSHTQTRESGPGPTACAGLQPDSGGTGPGIAETGEETGEETETGDGDPEDLNDDTGENAERNDTGEDALPDMPVDTGENSRKVYEWEEVPEGAPPMDEWLAPFQALHKCFDRENPFGYPDLNLERRAMKFLAARISMLGTEKDTPEKIACQFVFAFKNMIENAPYFEGMQCFPTMLINPKIYTRVYAKVGKILYPRGFINTTWKDQWDKSVIDAQKDQKDHDPIRETRLIYEKAGIDPNDPERSRKLMIQKAGLVKK